MPRLRGGSDEISNWQPLCDECNNFKSTACRDCQLDCETCCWAYPEKFKPFHIPGELVKCLREHAQKLAGIPMNYSLKLLQIILKTKIRKTHRLMVSVIRVCVFFCYRGRE